MQMRLMKTGTPQTKTRTKNDGNGEKKMKKNGLVRG